MVMARWRSIVRGRALLEVRGELVGRCADLGRQLGAEMPAVPVVDPANHLPDRPCPCKHG